MASASRTDRRAAAARAGFTLLEMMGVIAVLALLSTLVGLAWRREARQEVPEPGPAARIAAAHRRAIATGAAVPLTVAEGGRTLRVTALPDGRLLGADSLGFDPLDAQPLESAAAGGATSPGPAGGR